MNHNELINDHNDLQGRDPVSVMSIKDIKKWFEVAIPEPTIEQACIQIGCHYEEVAEMGDALLDDADQVGYVANDYKALKDHSIVSASNALNHEQTRIDLLDSLCDQIVTAIGVAHMLGMDIEMALKEVNESNYSKFEGGKAVFNEQGKITKGVNYRAPKLDNFI